MILFMVIKYKLYTRKDGSCSLVTHCTAGSIFRIAPIFQLSLSDTAINVLHMLRGRPLVSWMIYLQSTTATVVLSMRILSTLSVLVPGEDEELLSIPCIADRIPSRHSPLETN